MGLLKLCHSAAAVVLLFAGNPDLLSQQYVVSTYAGAVPPPILTPALLASFGNPLGLATDGAGNIYFASDNCVFEFSPSGVVTRVAGNSRNGYTGDGGPAVNAQLGIPQGVALDGNGNIYIDDWDNVAVRKVTKSGTITTVASGSLSASPPHIYQPYAIAADSAGNVYIVDGRYYLSKITTSGDITVLAGNGVAGYTGDGGFAKNAQINLTRGMAADNAGNIYFSDGVTSRIRRITASGAISTIAGTGTAGYSGDGGLATLAQLNEPDGVAVDSAGNLYIADNMNNRIRKVTPSGIISTIAGNGVFGSNGDGGLATKAALTYPQTLFPDNLGNLYFVDSSRLRRVNSAGVISTVAGGSSQFFGDNVPATTVNLPGVQGVAADANNNLFVSAGNAIRRISASGTISTFAGSGAGGFSGDKGPATNALFNNPSGLAFDKAGNLYVADGQNHRIRQITPSGTVTTLAGSGVEGYSGDGGLATNARLNAPAAVAVDAVGNIYIADTFNYRIRRVSPSGIITTIAGTGTTGYSGDGGSGTLAQIGPPFGIAVDSAQNVYIADTSNMRIRRVSPGGTISTFAGSGIQGVSGDGGPASLAQLCNPEGVTVDSAQNVYIADSSNARIRRVTPDGTISTIAGNGGSAYTGDGGLAVNAEFSVPNAVAADSAGNLYISDFGNKAVRQLQKITMYISAVANAATNYPGAIAPGEIVVLYGLNLGPAALSTYQLNGSGRVSSVLAGTTVTFNGIAAPLLYASASQVSAIVPYEISGASAEIGVSYQGQTSLTVTVPVAPATPGLFTADSTGQGQLAAVNQDGSINGPSHPAVVGSYIALFATGEGLTTPVGVDGLPAPSPAAQPLLPVTITIGGQTVTPVYAGGAPGEVEGLMQVNAQIPLNLVGGNAVPVWITIGGVTSPGATTLAVSRN